MPAMPGDDRSAVPVAAIYGANASGKSNLLDGLTYMAVGVLTSKVLGAWPRSIFRLDVQAPELPSTFVIEILAEGTRYTYGFRASDEAVVEEWLYAYPEKRRRVVFERTGDELRFGSTSAGLRSKFTALEELIRGDVLVLSSCSGLELGPLMPVYRWFERNLRITPVEGTWASDEVGSRVGNFLQRDARNSRRLLSLLTAADVGIADVIAEQVDEPLGYQETRLVTARSCLRATMEAEIPAQEGRRAVRIAR
ncbi:ATP/GTP-binding protein [Amycolatopsis umgeniensis]|uniref:ATPase AAA-type core domain-containing protein n=1 Tax=Amycolatopsis umgeniensis TaxID=336628 RepID=A0A841BB73_9PSEU|nr:AAA family ATPase [Amycolatopsis umgeniensis]MBB5856577.1 hypothetical protein [Amycolatopsis umgeniensis]